MPGCTASAIWSNAASTNSNTFAVSSRVSTSWTAPTWASSTSSARSSGYGKMSTEPKEDLRAYLVSLRQKCHTTLLTLTDEQANRTVEYPWSDGQPVSFLELQLYNLRHIQEHAAQLSLVLGQHDIPNEALDWVPEARS